MRILFWLATWYDTLHAEYEALRVQFDQQTAGVSARVQGLWQAIKEELNRYTGVIEAYPVPEPYWGQELGEGLYNSERGYLDQVESYKLFQGRLAE